ncbi:MAG TPA: class I SAM-dependent methyltransferase, partial [Saprospiraceae bacterium]|nr:class I SAM-dependent methyltransferase [Saprospiraceae bacterium]
SSILDIGCGIGRIAIPLTSYLNEEGSYNGFDIVKEGIDWCTKNINHRFSNFTFLHIPLQNELYNLSTKVKSSLLTFPYISDHFDLVIATSVFTHMMPEDVENYF